MPRLDRGRLPPAAAIGRQATVGTCALADPTGDLHAIGHQATTGHLIAGDPLGAIGFQGTTSRTTPALYLRGRQATTGRAGAGGLVAWGRQGTRSLVTPSILCKGRQVTLGQVAPGGGIGAFANGYDHRAKLGLPGQADLSGTLTNLVFRLKPEVLAAAELKTVANGGKVRSSGGFDIRFELGGDDAGGTGGVKLDHQFVVPYDPTAGAIDVRIRIPSWSITTDCRPWLYVGKAGLAASEENPTGLWTGAMRATRLDTGADLSGGARALAPSGVTAGFTLAGMPAGRFSAAGYCRKLSPAYVPHLTAATSEIIFQLDAVPGPTDSGNLDRIGGTPLSAETHSRYSTFVYQGGKFSPGANWYDSGTGHQTNEGVETAAGVVDASLMHCMGVRQSGRASLAYVKGVAVPTTTLNPPVPAGPSVYLNVLANDEDTVGAGEGAQTTCLPGLYALDIQWPQACSAAFCAMRYRSEIECRSVAGMGAFDAAGDADESPVAAPWRTTNDGNQQDYDVAARAFDPDGDPVTLTAVGASTHAGDTTSLTGGKVRYARQPGWAGGVAEVPFTVGDARGKASSSRLWLAVTPSLVNLSEGLAPPFPASTATIKGPVAIGQLQATYNALTAAEIAGGVTILVTPGGTLAGGLTLGKSGLRGAGTDLRPQFPIIIRTGTLSGARIVDPAGFPAATITGSVTLSGSYNWLRGLKIGGVPPITGTGNRFNRCAFTAQTRDRGVANWFDWCEWSNMAGVFHQCQPVQGCRQPQAYRLYMHTDVGTVPGNRVFWQVGFNDDSTAIPTFAYIRDCLFADPFNDRDNRVEQAVELKCSDNVVERCAALSRLTPTVRPLRFNVRHGQRNKFLALWCDKGQIEGRGPDHLSADCVITGSDWCGPSAGNCTYPQWLDFAANGNQSGKYPSADRWRVVRCNSVGVGDDAAGGGLVPPVGTQLWNITGSATLLNGAAVAAGDIHAGNPADVPPRADLGAIRWATSKVGPNGVYSASD